MCVVCHLIVVLILVCLVVVLSCRAAIEFLEEQFATKNRFLRAVTSKGTLMTTIAFRSEEPTAGVVGGMQLVLDVQPVLCSTFALVTNMHKQCAYSCLEELLVGNSFIFGWELLIFFSTSKSSLEFPSCTFLPSWAERIASLLPCPVSVKTKRQSYAPGHFCGSQLPRLIPTQLIPAAKRCAEETCIEPRKAFFFLTSAHLCGHCLTVEMFCFDNIHP